MQDQSFTTSFLVDQSPEEVFNAVTNVRGWWSEEIEGDTANLNDEFLYHYQDAHICKMKLIEVVPNKKVVWLVLDNYFNFTKDKSEWKDTKIIFEIAQKGNQTQLHFTHQGLVPEYECYEVCNDAWSNYIRNSLRSLIVTGKGQPNPKEGGFNSELLKKWKLQAQPSHFTVTILTDKTPKEAFDAINNVPGWWSGEVKGATDKLDGEFTYTVPGVHFSRQKITELIPGKKVAWSVVDANLSFAQNKSEWKGTSIVFDIAKKGGQTEVRFTHVGLVPAYECYKDCSNAWGLLVSGNLKNLIATGEVQPSPWQ